MAEAVPYPAGPASRVDSRGEGAIRVEPRGVEVDGTTQASGNPQPSDGIRAYGRVDDATRFLRELRRLRSEAGLEAVELAARAHYPHDVIVAAEAGPGLPELPVLSAYVRGCGGGLAEWEERWRSVTGSPATSLHLPARPAGCSSLAEAGAQAAYNSPAVVDPEHQRRIMAAITRSAAETAEATIPAQQPLARPPAPPAAAAPELPAPAATAAVPAAAAPTAPAPRDVTPRAGAATPAAAAAAREPVAATGAGPASGPASPPAAGATRRSIAARGASLPYGAGIAAIVAALMCIVGTILLLLR
jgi:hypothetical protein